MLRFALFGVVALLVFGGGVTYVGSRVAASLPPRLRIGGWLLVGLLALVATAGMSLSRSASTSSWVEGLQLGGYIGFGVLSLLLAGFVCVDLSQHVLRWGLGVAERTPAVNAPLVAPERRVFMVACARAVVVGVTGWIAIVGYRQARRLARVVEVDIPIADLPVGLHGFRIVQLSDIHVGPTIRRGYLQAIVDRVNELNADMVAITGDLIDGSVAVRGHDVQPLETLQSRHGTFFCTGNHEYYSGAEEWLAFLRSLDVRTLVNAHEALRHDGHVVVVAGVTDYSAERMLPSHASDPAQAIAGAPSDAAARILLAHQPRSAFAAGDLGFFDLQLSGHTHGGQYSPWTFLVGLVQPFAAGLHRLGRMWIYTSRGTGYWGPPIRFGASSEITLLRLVPADPMSA